MTTDPALTPEIRRKQAENTARMLEDLAIDIKLRGSDSPKEKDTPAPIIDGCGAQSNVQYKDIRENEIRLLALPDEAIYVFVYEATDEVTYIVIPFAKYNNPATDEEIRIGNRTAEDLSVLQLWNARTMCSMLLRQSYLIGTLTDEEVEQVHDAYDCDMFGGVSKYADQMGSPITYMEDPRVMYKYRSLERFHKIDALDLLLLDLLGDALDPNSKPRRKQNYFRIMDTGMNAVQYLTLFDKSKRTCVPEIGTRLYRFDGADDNYDFSKLPEGWELNGMRDVLFFNPEYRCLVGVGYADDKDGIVMQKYLQEHDDRVSLLDPSKLFIVLCDPFVSDSIEITPAY